MMPEPRCGVGRRLEERGRDDVLDLRAPGERVHRERECAERDRAGDQPLGNAALLEHLGSEWIDGEHDDEQRHAAVSQDRADNDDRQHCPRLADHMDHRGDDRLREARELDHLAEDRAQHEHREVVLDEADHLVHEHAGEHRQHERGIGEHDGEERRDRREHDHAVAAIGDEHQEDERQQNDEETHCVFPLDGWRAMDVSAFR